MHFRYDAPALFSHIFFAVSRASLFLFCFRDPCCTALLWQRPAILAVSSCFYRPYRNIFHYVCFSFTGAPLSSLRAFFSLFLVLTLIKKLNHDVPRGGVNELYRGKALAWCHCLFRNQWTFMRQHSLTIEFARPWKLLVTLFQRRGKANFTTSIAKLNHLPVVISGRHVTHWTGQSDGLIFRKRL